MNKPNNRQNNSMKRGRNQRRGRSGGNNPNRALDSNGPDVRIRGTANQIYDKYQGLARDAASAGDRVRAENYLQHAEHYFRLIKSMQPPQQQQQAQPAEASPSEPVDVDGEQPVIDGEQKKNRTRSQDKPVNDDKRDNDTAEEAAPVKEDAAAEAPVKATEGEEADTPPVAEKKPRKRRVKRTAKKDDDAQGSDTAEEAVAS